MGVVVEAICSALLRFRLTIDLLDDSGHVSGDGERVHRRWVIGIERRAPGR